MKVSEIKERSKTLLNEASLKQETLNWAVVCPNCKSIIAYWRLIGSKGIKCNGCGYENRSIYYLIKCGDLPFTTAI